MKGTPDSADTVWSCTSYSYVWNKRWNNKGKSLRCHGYDSCLWQRLWVTYLSGEIISYRFQLDHLELTCKISRICQQQKLGQAYMTLHSIPHFRVLKRVHLLLRSQFSNEGVSRKEFPVAGKVGTFTSLQSTGCWPSVTKVDALRLSSVGSKFCKLKVRKRSPQSFQSNHRWGTQ